MNGASCDILTINSPGMAVRLHPGFKRADNQDWIEWRSDENRLVCVVCDGVGGLRYGDRASKEAARSFVDHLIPQEGGHSCWNQAGIPDLDTAGLAVRRSIARLQANLSEQRLGTTLTGLCLTRQQFWVLHIGDTRAYLWRRGKLHQLSQDHTVAAESRLTPVCLDQQQHNNVLTRSLGNPSRETFDVIHQSIEEGDRLVLCSDGLESASITREELTSFCNSEPSAIGLADELLCRALVGGAPDNISIVVIHPWEVFA